MGNRASQIPHLPWVTHAMRGFNNYGYAKAHADINAPGIYYGIRCVEGSWEWYYPQYEIEGDLFDIWRSDKPGEQFENARIIISELREALNEALHEIKMLT